MCANPSETIERLETLIQAFKKQSDNWEINPLFSEYFKQPVRFITYTGIKDLSKIKTKPYLIRGVDPDRERIQIGKLHILFAFPKEKMPDVKPYVKIRTAVKAQNLQPLEDPNERFHVDDEVLQQAQQDKSNVNLVTRTGHVLNGCILHFDKYILYMQIGGQVVVVYRHGLFGFTIPNQED